MRTIRLGRTNIVVNSLGFGALPIQRAPMAEAVRILHRAVEAGVNFFDTARVYTDSEEKLGAALADKRKDIIIATKSFPGTADFITKSIETSLKNLRTEYVDLLQIHNPKKVPMPGDGSEMYEALSAAREAGKARFIGLTAHSLDNAVTAAQSGLYDTVQFPFSAISSDKELNIAAVCKKEDVGFIAMKALGGGLIRHIPATFAFIRQYENVLPIWGIQKMTELEEFIHLESNPPAWGETTRTQVEQERKDLGASFCRACGYCLPCPANIDIPFVARSVLLLGRQPVHKLMTPEAKEKIARAFECTQCGVCKTRCPYDLDTPELVRVNAEGFTAYMRSHGGN